MYRHLAAVIDAVGLVLGPVRRGVGAIVTTTNRETMAVLQG